MSSITEVAKKCGVSKGTVSRILNGYQTGFSVRPELRKKILEVAKELNYRPNIAARSLTLKTNKLIAVLSSHRVSILPGVDQLILNSMVSLLHTLKYDVCTAIPFPREEGVTSELPPWSIGGAVIISHGHAQAVMELEQAGIPYVCINTTPGSKGAAVLVDDIHGMQTCLEHLFDLGHKRIAYYNFQHGTRFSKNKAEQGSFQKKEVHSSVIDRHETYLKVLSDRGIGPPEGHNVNNISADELIELAVRQGKATAIVSYDHFGAVDLISACHRKGISIPEDLSIICFNDQYPCEQIFPNVSAMAVPARDMGMKAAKILSGMIVDQKRPVHHTKLIENLIIRESTGPAPK